MSEFRDLPRKAQEGIIRGIEDIEAGRHKVIHVEEPRIPTTEEVLDAWVAGNQLPHYEIGNPADAKTTDELEEEFNEFIESIRLKAWLAGLEFAKNLKGQES